MRPSLPASITIIGLFLIGSTGLSEPADSVDSTEIPEPAPPGQFIRDVLFKLPGYILYVPFFVLENVSSEIVPVVAETDLGPSMIEGFI